MTADPSGGGPAGWKPDLDLLDSTLDEHGADGFLIDADGSDPDQRYISGYDAADPFLTLYTPGTTALLFWGTDAHSAAADSRADAVHTAAEYGYEGYGSSAAQHRVTRTFLDDYGIGSVLVPDRFPFARASALQRAGIEVLSTTEPTLEREVRAAVFDRGCTLPVSVIATGGATADPHGTASGPIQVDDPVLVDLCPCEGTTGYHADVCRTLYPGDPDPAFVERHEHVQEALELAGETITPGVSKAGLNDTLCSFFEDLGYSTPRSDGGVNTGAEIRLLHYMIHGVGLAIHERPLCVPEAEGNLRPGHVVAIEPALYGSDVGIRLEDVIVVTEDGCEILSRFPRSLSVEA